MSLVLSQRHFSSLNLMLFMSLNISNSNEIDENRQTLRTPDRLEKTVEFYSDDSEQKLDENELEDEDDNGDSEESNSSVVNNSNVVEEIPYIPNEWQIMDLSTGKFRSPRQHEFLRLLLKNSRYKSFVSWVEEKTGVFQIHRPEEVAKLWQQVKNRHTEKPMDYNTFARGIRHYYKAETMIKTNRKYTFQFNLSKPD